MNSLGTFNLKNTPILINIQVRRIQQIHCLNDLVFRDVKRDHNDEVWTTRTRWRGYFKSWGLNSQSHTKPRFRLESYRINVRKISYVLNLGTTHFGCNWWIFFECFKQILSQRSDMFIRWNLLQTMQNWKNFLANCNLNSEQEQNKRLWMSVKLLQP